MQAAHTTPQAISRLQYRVFIRNRLRGANVAQSKLLRGGKGGLSYRGYEAIEAIEAIEAKDAEDAEDAEGYFCVVVSRGPGARAGRAMV